MMADFGRILIIIGLVIAFAGFVILVAVRIFPWLGNLPGDFRIEGENFNIYFPLATMILISDDYCFEDFSAIMLDHRKHQMINGVYLQEDATDRLTRCKTIVLAHLWLAALRVGPPFFGENIEAFVNNMTEQDVQ